MMLLYHYYITLIENTKVSLQTHVADKRVNVLKNVGYDTITKISKIIDGESESVQPADNVSAPNDMTFFKYAHITSTDVERTFSRYNNLLTYKRRSRIFENIAKMIVILSWFIFEILID